MKVSDTRVPHPHNSRAPSETLIHAARVSVAYTDCKMSAAPTRTARHDAPQTPEENGAITDSSVCVQLGDSEKAAVQLPSEIET